jgi:hypothetical protein
MNRESFSKEKDDEKKHEKPNLKGDYRNLMLLFVLYVLQGKKIKLKKS